MGLGYSTEKKQMESVESVESVTKKYLDRTEAIDVSTVSIPDDIILPVDNSVPSKNHVVLEKELKDLYIKQKNLDPVQVRRCGAYTLVTWLYIEANNQEFVREACPLVKQIIEARKSEIHTVHEPQLAQLKTHEEIEKKQKYIDDRTKLIEIYKERLVLMESKVLCPISNQ